MADFQPRFVDLVRNYTSTQGTGAFALGPAVNGYTGFAAALQPGDSFYYSAIGVDKPAEREVGRGTLQANGTISREAISGSLTNFSNGTKTVALIAAAEWFTKLEAGGASGGSVAATRSALAASPPTQKAMLLAEPRREGLFVFDSTNLASKVAADTAQAVYVPPASDPSGASGAWVRKRESDYLHIDWFGAAGDGSTDDTPAFVALRSIAGALATGAGSGARQGPEIRLGRKVYYLASSFDCKGFCGTWRGAGGGFETWNNTGGTQIKLASGASFIIQRADTEGTGAGTTIPYGADGSSFHDITFRGPGNGIGTAPVVHLRANSVSFYNCRTIEGGSHGLQIKATAGGGGANEGNANCWLIVGGSYSNNGGSGIYTAGSDANAGRLYGASCSGNARYGVEEESFLGNEYSGLHCDGNALGHIHGTGESNSSRFAGYFESGYPICTIPPRATVESVGGINPVAATGGAALYADSGLVTVNGLQIFRSESGKFTQAKIGKDLSSGTLFSVSNNNFGNGTLTWDIYARQDADVIHFSLNNGSIVYAALNGNGTSAAPARYTHGLGTAPTGAFSLKELYLGDGSALNGRRLISGSAAPAAGEHAQGELAFNQGITAASPLFAWACTLGGTPGTHTPLYALTAAPAAIATSGSASDLTTGSIPAGRVANGTLTYSMHANTAALRLLGNPTGSAAAMSEISLGANLGFSGTALQVQFAATSRLLGRSTVGAGAAEEISVANGITLTATTLGLGAITPTSVAATGAITSSGATNGIGYAAGAGGAVTQLTNKSTGVTLNKASGQITTSNAALAAAAIVEFTVTNSAVVATDTINLNLASGAAASTAYRYWVSGVAAGTFKIVVENRSGSSLSEALTFNFAVLKAVAA